MNEFEQYVQQYHIDTVHLGQVAEVRLLTIHNAKRDQPILPENAQKITDALFRLTGVRYTGSFVLIETEDKPNALPSHPSRIKKVPGRHHV